MTRRELAAEIRKRMLLAESDGSLTEIVVCSGAEADLMRWFEAHAFEIAAALEAQEKPTISPESSKALANAGGAEESPLLSGPAPGAGEQSQCVPPEFIAAARAEIEPHERSSAVTEAIWGVPRPPAPPDLEAKLREGERWLGASITDREFDTVPWIRWAISTIRSLRIELTAEQVAREFELSRLRADRDAHERQVADGAAVTERLHEEIAAAREECERRAVLNKNQAEDIRQMREERSRLRAELHVARIECRSFSDRLRSAEADYRAEIVRLEAELQAAKAENELLWEERRISGHPTEDGHGPRLGELAVLLNPIEASRFPPVTPRTAAQAQPPAGPIAPFGVMNMSMLDCNGVSYPEWYVCRGGEPAICICEDEADAHRVAAALNAAKGKP